MIIFLKILVYILHKYLEYGLYKSAHLTRDECLYWCVPHEDCLYEDEEEED